MTLEDCKAKCLENCSCTAYANLDTNGKGSGCAPFGLVILLIWEFQKVGKIYVRMAISDTGKDNDILLTFFN